MDVDQVEYVEYDESDEAWNPLAKRNGSSYYERCFVWNNEEVCPSIEQLQQAGDIEHRAQGAGLLSSSGGANHVKHPQLAGQCFRANINLFVKIRIRQSLVHLRAPGATFEDCWHLHFAVIIKDGWRISS